MRRGVGVIVGLALLCGGSATADWKKVATTNSSDLLSAFARFADGKQILVGGMRVDMSGGGIPSIGPVLYWSQDGGSTFQVVKNMPTEGGLMGAGIQDLYAVSDKSLWAVAGSGVFGATQVGAPWKEKKLGSAPSRVHMFDATTGVLIGEKGMAWRTEDGATWTEVPTGEDADLQCMFWLDSKHGFAAGVATTEDDPQNTGQTVTTFHASVFLATSDGGKSWTKVSSPTDGHGPCPMYFLDTQTGWLATAEEDPSMGRAGPAHVWKTTDGGKTFTDLKVDVSVGKGMFNMPIQASYFTVMFWADALNGHLGGDAYVVDTSSGGGSSTPPVYKLVDYVTHDGGQTWTHTDLGTVNIDLGGGSLPPTDGRTIGGEMLSMVEGFMTAETGAIYRYEATCTTHEECGLGYACGAKGVCVPVLVPDGDGGCIGAACGTDREVVVGTDDDATVGADGTTPILPCGDACTSGSSSGGCSAGAPAGTGWAAVLMLALGALARRRQGPTANG